MKRITVLAAAFLAVSAAPGFAAMSDQEFVTKAAIGGKYEFQSSLFALTASPDARVKAFANRMVIDHTDLNARLNAIAERERLSVPYALDATHDDMLKKLEAAELQSDGHAQQLYVTQQKKAHDETLALFERYVAEGKNVRLRDFAQAALPVLREHGRAITPLAQMAAR